MEKFGKAGIQRIDPQLRIPIKVSARHITSIATSFFPSWNHPPPIDFPSTPLKKGQPNPQLPSPPLPYSSSPSTWPRGLSGPSVFFFEPTSFSSSAFIGVLVWLPDMNSAWAPWWYGVSEIGKVVEGGPPKFIPLFPKTHFRDFSILFCPYTVTISETVFLPQSFRRMLI